MADNALVFANTDRSTSTVQRPTATGTENFTVMQDPSAPTQFSWHLTVGEGQELTTLPDGRIAVINPRPAPMPDAKLTLFDVGTDITQPGAQAPAPEDAGAQAEAVGNTGAQLDEAAETFDVAQQQTPGEVVLVFPKPWALDAERQPVPVTLSARDDIVTMTVDRDATAAYPVVASPAPTASAAAIGGPMRSLTFNIRGQYPKGGPSSAPRGGTAAEFETHRQRITSVIYTQLGATDTRGYVPSVAGLQEVCRSDYTRIIEILNQRDPISGWTGEFQRLQGGTLCPGDDFGNAILRNVSLVTGGNLVATDYEVYTTQNDGPRGYIRDRLNIRGRSVFTFDTHLAATGLLSTREAQARQLSDAAALRSDFPRLVMGDFNLSYQKASLFDNQRGILNTFFYNRGYGEVDSDTNTPTTPSDDPVDKLDYIFYSQAQMSLNGGSVKPIDEDSAKSTFPCREADNAPLLPCTSDHRPLVGSTTVTG